MDETRILEAIPDEMNISKERKSELLKLRDHIKSTISESIEGLNTFEEFLTKLGCSIDDYVLAIRVKLKTKKVFIKHLLQTLELMVLIQKF